VVEVATERLLLRVPAAEDLESIFGMYSDPQVWAADPLSRQEDRAQTGQMIANWLSAWERDGLGLWTAWAGEDFAGIGGCFARYEVAWNLGFRLRPSFWGRGFAREIGGAGIRAARNRRPDLPVTAYLLEGNDRSRRTVEGLGLHRVWRGPDAGNPDPTAVRLLHSDRPLSPSVVSTLTRR
jgi:RimJ/RimL family protein N-acetyltransferase